ncbi:MAG: NfeD family protein [Acidimicrobiales bacterium]
MFIAIGILGAVLLLSSLLFDGWIDEVVPGPEFLSGPELGALLVTFGLFGWYAENGLSWALVPAVGLASVTGAGMAYLTYRATKALMGQPTDATPTTASLIGKSGKVVTPLTGGRLGEVIVSLGGATTKYTAVADDDLPVGTPVVVVAVESPTKVRVQAESSFWT